ncbi:MAG: hydroxylamine oxidase [Nitrospirae bacterium]|nr:hydroxylamine oxidase [Nitrospirota bacterium]
MTAYRMGVLGCTIAVVLFISSIGSAGEKEESHDADLSPQTQACIGCHSSVTPGIVEDWLTSRHSRTTPEKALTIPAIQRRMSAGSVPAELGEYAVGCYECHSLNPDRHQDNFQHMGYRINVVVSPNDCNTCHPVEVDQYTGSKKGQAWKNIMSNPVYHALVSTTDGVKKVDNGRISMTAPSPQTLQETCLGCHGTRVEVKGMKKVYSGSTWGEITVPDLTNWPSQGVGRENPDGSVGSCTSCHPRHGFSIKVARKPYTCGQCHLDPDVPAYNVYKESKHGTLYETFEDKWNFESVPWRVGKDFTAPTCAACHNSLLTAPDGTVIAQRTHDFGARLWVRLFGLIYAHPQPKDGNTTIIRNKDGLPLPTTFLNEPASDFLIDKTEQEKRYDVMKNVCRSCHTTRWITDHFAKMDNTVKETNEMTLTATKLMTEAWDSGAEDRTNPFDEQVEKLWVRQWLFYASSVRYASAMTGAPDYAAFKNGWWELSDNLQKMRDTIDQKKNLRKPALSGSQGK